MFPVVRHTIEETFAAQFAAKSGRNGVPGHRLPLASFRVEQKPTPDFSGGSLPPKFRSQKHGQKKPTNDAATLTTANQRAARIAVAGRLDSTPDIPPTKVYTNCTTNRKSKHAQGNTTPKKRCFGSPLHWLCC
jgi:hypothetical protein